MEDNECVLCRPTKNMEANELYVCRQCINKYKMDTIKYVNKKCNRCQKTENTIDMPGSYLCDECWIKQYGDFIDYH